MNIMTMKTMILLAAPLLLTPLASLAATYDYVDTSGTVQAVSANSASAALTTAPNIAVHSGVALADGTPIAGSSGGAVLGASGTAYNYVDTSGIVQTVTASTPAAAIATAPNISVHSGVTVADGAVIPGVSVTAQ